MSFGLFISTLYFLFELLAGALFYSPPKKFIPPGTVQISDTLYADISEVTLQTWAEYRIHTSYRYGNNSEEYKATKADSAVWLWGSMNSNEPYQSQHLAPMLYRDYPVVGITYEQALAFCRWRTDFVKSQLDKMRKYKGLSITYRLPTAREWEYLAHSCLEVFNHKNSFEILHPRPDQTIYRVNYAANVFINDSVKPQIYTEPTGRYAKNFFGLYDIIGNTAEMTLEKGICKGGSWNHDLEESRPGKDISYTKPEPWLGFRCVCIVRYTN